MSSRTSQFGLFLSYFCATLSVACGASPGSPEAPEGATPTSASPDLLAEAPELTADEQTIRENLRLHVEHLAGKIGERNVKENWQLAEAADHLAGVLTELGFPVERQGYEVGQAAAQNLVVTVPGGQRGDEILVVGAHYDSPSGERGYAQGGASTAALLEIARMMRDAKLTRSLRLVFYSTGESPAADGEGRGARHYSRALFLETQNTGDAPGLPASAQSHVRTLGVIHLERMGLLSSRSGESSSTLLGLSASSGSERLKAELLEALSGPPLVISDVRSVPGEDSDSSAFYEQGIPALTVMGAFKGHRGSEGDIDYEELSRVVMRIRRGIGGILGEMPTNDEMLTPPLLQIR